METKNQDSGNVIENLNKKIKDLEIKLKESDSKFDIQNSQISQMKMNIDNGFSQLNLVLSKLESKLNTKSK